MNTETATDDRLKARIPTQARGNKRVLDIRRAAIALLGSKDVSAITVADVARKAGLGIGTFYHYYPTKEALFLELRAQIFAETADSLSHAFDEPISKPSDFLTALTSLARQWIDMAATYRGLERAIVGLSFESPAVAAALHEQEEPVRQLVSSLFKKYQMFLRPRDAEEAAATIVVLLEAVVTRTMRQPDLAADPDWLIAQSVSMVAHYLLPDALIQAEQDDDAV